MTRVSSVNMRSSSKTQQLVPIGNWFVSAVAMLGLFLLGGGALMGVAMGNVALALLLITFAIKAPHERLELVRSPFVWLTVAYVFFLVLQLIVGYSQSTVPVAVQFGDFTEFISIGYLAAMVTGYWLYKKPHFQFAIFLIVPLGLFARVIEKWEPGALSRAFYGSARFTFGDSAVDFGLWSLVAAVCALSLMRGALAMRNALWRNVVLSYLTAAFSLAAVGIVLAKTRSVWLIAPIVLPLAAATGLWPELSRRNPLRVAAGVAVIMSGLSVAIFWGFGEIFVARWKDAQQAVGLMVDGNWYALDSGSIGLRLQMAYEGLQLWAEHPFLGHGFASAPGLLAQSPIEGIASRGFTHFHNTAVTLLVEHGLIGFSLFAVLFIFSVRALCLGLREDDTGVRGAALLGILAMAGQSFSDYVIGGYRDPFMIALFCGTAVACHLCCLRRGSSGLDSYLKSYRGEK